jgi:hypothetical protein
VNQKDVPLSAHDQSQTLSLGYLAKTFFFKSVEITRWQLLIAKWKNTDNCFIISHFLSPNFQTSKSKPSRHFQRFPDENKQLMTGIALPYFSEKVKVNRGVYCNFAHFAFFNWSKIYFNHRIIQV